MGLLAIAGLLVGGGAGIGLSRAEWTATEAADTGPGCDRPVIVDGDTLRCGAQRIRLAGIDAPELPGHCRQGRVCAPGDPVASADHLRMLVAAGAMSCRQTDTDAYGRAVARCAVAGRDLSCAQLSAGLAIARYGTISC